MQETLEEGNTVKETGKAQGNIRDGMIIPECSNLSWLYKLGLKMQDAKLCYGIHPALELYRL